MANTISRQIIMGDSTSHRYVVLLKIIGDGSGEETATRVNEVSGDLGLNPKLVKMKGATSGFSLQLLWEGTPDVFVQQIPSDQEIDLCYERIGGLINNASTETGDLVFTTAGLGNGDSATLLFEFIRD